MKRLWLKAYNGGSDRCRSGNNMSVLTTDGEAVSLSDMAIAPRRREEPAVQAVDQSLEVNDGCVPSRLL
ncbi:hypothetical protein YC2023_008789 [Brassica napus]